MTGVPIRQRPCRHRVHLAVVAVERLPDRGAVGQPPHPDRTVTVAAAADDDLGAIRKRRDRHRGHLIVAVQRLPDRNAVVQPPHPHRAVLAAADDDRDAIRQRAHRHRDHLAGVAAQRLPERGAVGEPPHPDRAVLAAAHDDWGAIRESPHSHCIHLAGVAGEDLVVGGWAAVGPAGLPGPVGGGASDARGHIAAAEVVGGQFELAGPRWSAEVGEAIGALPVHGGGCPRRDGSRGVEVGHQPRRIDGNKIVRILQELIEPTGGGGVLGRVVARVAVLPAGVLGLAEEHVQQGAFVAGLVPRGEQLVG
jgi:hypothetical protein